MSDFSGAAHHIRTYQRYREHETSDDGGILPLILIGGIIIYAIYVIVWFLLKRWSTPESKDEGFSKNKLALAYISLSAQMLRKEVVDVREKSNFIKSHIHKHFPKQIESFSVELNYAINHPVSAAKTSFWIKTHLNHKDRLQVMYFLAAVAFMDGGFNSNELKLLRDLQSQLEISPKEFDQIIAIYTQREERQREGFGKKRKSGKSSLQLAFEILGVSENASWDEIKKAYRELVNVHHPDRFASESKEQQEIAQQRFIEIQKAYELIEVTK